jgi:hypothetical protein
MRTNLLAYLLPLGLLIGCGGADPSSDSASVSAALDSSTQTANESALMVAATAGTESATSAIEAANMAGGGAKTNWQPAGCVTSTENQNVVTYTLSDCTGPYGIVHVTGSVIATYTVDSAGIHAALQTTNLHINGATMSLDSKVDYTVNGTAKSLSVNTDGSGTGAFGNTITRNGSYTLTWDDATACGTLNGAWSTGLNSATWSTSITNYAQCAGFCPKSGLLSHTGGISHTTWTVTFDGSAQAKWTSSKGPSGVFGLLCLP